LFKEKKNSSSGAKEAQENHFLQNFIGVGPK
jgi:hypothetical protein